MMRTVALYFFVLLFQIGPLPFAAPASPWPRHTIDASSRGADGVRLADVDSDRRPDLVTGWEEGGVVRIYRNPGPADAKAAWPAATVGSVRSVEDAVFVDLDNDGATDVVSSCEGSVRTIFFHWSPKPDARRFEGVSWRTVPLPVSAERMMWMFCLPLEIDAKNGIDLVAGGKGAGAQIGWFASPENPRIVEDWRWHPLRDAGWIMSLAASDMDGDGDLDILFSDRKGNRSGCYWLENPAAPSGQLDRWTEHPIGGLGKEAMFLVQSDLDQDGLEDVILATRPREILWFRRLDRTGTSWQSHRIPLPEEAGDAKGINVADLDLDGTLDLVFSCEHAKAPKSGVMWLAGAPGARAPKWQSHDISGPAGTKFDLVELLDLDGDGDLDVITCEEA